MRSPLNCGKTPPASLLYVCVAAKNEKLIDVCHARIIDFSSGNFRVCFLCVNVCFVERQLIFHLLTTHRNFAKADDGVSMIIL
jgi:hypothetical protein